MDSSDFCRLHEVTQINMVAAGEVRMGIMSVPGHDGPLRVCFWCGEPIDILLFGDMTAQQKQEFEEVSAVNDQAPSMVVTDHEPCATCTELMSRGVCIMEAEGEGAAAIATGRYWVFRDSVIREMITTPALCASILRKRRALISEEVAKHLGLYDIEPSGRVK